MILIATIAEDLHAQIVKGEIDKRRPYSCHILELDRLAQAESLSFGIAYDAPDRILDADGVEVAVSACDILWLRRVPSHQTLRAPIEDEHALQVVDNDCRGAALGILRTKFQGKWISSIEATTLASDKLAQLEAARAAGFRVPKTLVTQSRDDVEQMLDECGPIVVKTVVGASGPMLQTVRIEDLGPFDSHSISAAPAIYQEYIDGTDHLRLGCFGDRSFAGVIRTTDVDWRGNLNVPVERFTVETVLHQLVRATLDRLGLEMGVVDLKLTDAGEPVWLEVNPQGQFAFLDGLTDTNMVDEFADYLISEANEQRKQPATVA